MTTLHRLAAAVFHDVAHREAAWEITVAEGTPAAHLQRIVPHFLWDAMVSCWKLRQKKKKKKKKKSCERRRTSKSVVVTSRKIPAAGLYLLVVGCWSACMAPEHILE